MDGQCKRKPWSQDNNGQPMFCQLNTFNLKQRQEIGNDGLLLLLSVAECTVNGGADMNEIKSN